AVIKDLVVKVRAGRDAGRTDEADALALPHARASYCAFGKSRHVAVSGLVTIGVAQTHVFAVAGFPTDLFDRAVAGGVDRRAEWRGPVDARVHAHGAEDRMFARSERRAHV